MSKSSTAGANVRNLSGDVGAFGASLEFFLLPLKPFLEDPEVTEIIVNGPGAVYVERRGQMQTTDATFASDEQVQAAARNIAQFVGQPLSHEQPLMDGRLPDGSRVCIVLSPVAVGGTQINIRRFAQAATDAEFLLRQASVNRIAMEYLRLCVAAHQNIIVSGGAGSGKTTLVNVLTHAFADHERIIVIEDTRELKVQKKHVVQMEARRADQYGRGEISVRDLFVTSLRMRPDRIVVGEVRRGESLDMIQAMTSGHRGALATVHASTPVDACHRLETMALMADIGLPLVALRRQIASAVDVLVQVDRMPDGKRMITHISEVSLDESSNNYRVQDVFVLGSGENGAAPGQRQLQWTGVRPMMASDVVIDSLRDRIELTAELFRNGTA